MSSCPHNDFLACPSAAASGLSSICICNLPRLFLSGCRFSGLLSPPRESGSANRGCSDNHSSCYPPILARLEGMRTETDDMGVHLHYSCAPAAPGSRPLRQFGHRSVERLRLAFCEWHRCSTFRSCKHGTERVSMPSRCETRTVELTRGREAGAASLVLYPVFDP